MTKPVGYYVGRDTFFDELQERYGAQLQQLSCQAKLTFRASCAAFLCQLERYKDTFQVMPSMQLEQCIEQSIDSVDPDIWEENEELVNFIKRAATLSQSDIEGLIACLSEQLRYGGTA